MLAGEDAGRAARRAGRDQGPHADARDRDELRVGAVRGPRPRRGRDRRRADARGGRDRARQDDDVGVRARGLGEQPGVRRHGQPMGSDAVARRLVGRVGGSGRGGAQPGGGGLGCRAVDPHPGVVLRGARPQAAARAHPGRVRAHVLRDARVHRPADLDDPRRGAAHVGVGRAGRARSQVAAGHRRRLARRARRGSRRACASRWSPSLGLPADPEVVGMVGDAAAPSSGWAARSRRSTSRRTRRSCRCCIASGSAWRRRCSATASPSTGERMTPGVLREIERGRAQSAIDVWEAEIERSRWYDRVRAVLDAHDVIVCPTNAIPPPPADTVTYGPSEIDGRAVGPQDGMDAGVSVQPHDAPGDLDPVRHDRRRPAGGDAGRRAAVRGAEAAARGGALRGRRRRGERAARCRTCTPAHRTCRAGHSGRDARLRAWDHFWSIGERERVRLRGRLATALAVVAHRQPALLDAVRDHLGRDDRPADRLPDHRAADALALTR